MWSKLEEEMLDNMRRRSRIENHELEREREREPQCHKVVAVLVYTAVATGILARLQRQIEEKSALNWPGEKRMSWSWKWHILLALWYPHISNG